MHETKATAKQLEKQSKTAIMPSAFQHVPLPSAIKNISLIYLRFLEVSSTVQLC
jgi:hypothetical protein